MAKKNPELAHEGIGDISSILHNQGVSDLSWLSVDEDEYRASEAMPKQNLDMIPELQKALSMEKGDDVPHVIPMRPHTIVNTNPLEGLPLPVRDLSAPIRNRMAKLVMAGRSVAEIRDQLSLEFSPSEIRAASSVVREILAERGLLGNVYVNAAHFPLAARDPKEKKIAQLLSKQAKYVIGGCGGSNGCDCHQTGFCKTFGGKPIVAEVPYDSKLAAHYAPQLAAQKRPLDARLASSQSPALVKSALQAAFLTPVTQSRPDGVRTVHQQATPVKPQISAQDVIDFWNRRIESSGVDPMPSPIYMKYARRMASGMDDRALLSAAVEPELHVLANEYGLLGHTWLDMDALGGCNATLAMMQERGLQPDYVLRRSSACTRCMGTLDGACVSISRCSSVVTSKPVIDKQVFAFALRRASSQGRITHDQMALALEKASEGSNWASLTRQANLIQPPSEDHSQYSGAQVAAHYGTRGNELGKVQVDPEEVRRTISHLMNTGLHGHTLKNAVLNAYSRDDLVQVPQVGVRVASEDGIQGQYFIDPTAYHDYGRGCNDGAKLFRKRGAPHVMASDDCTGCNLQTAPGWCSKYAKTLIRTIPPSVREQVASAKRRLPVIAAPVVDISDKYQLSSEIEVDLNGAKSRGIDISIGGPSFDD